MATELARIENSSKSLEMRKLQVDALMRSVDVSKDLYLSARADYLEVLLTQRDALNPHLEIVETQKECQLVNVYLYNSLGGGWK